MFLFTLAQAAAETTAQTTTTGDSSWWHQGLIGWYVDGGAFMIPLFICQVIAVAIIIERVGAFRSIRMDTTAFRAKIKSLLAGGRVDDAIDHCDSTNGPLPATLAVGLRRYKLLKALNKPADQIEVEVSRAIDDYGPHLVAVLERHLPMLATIAALGPLFGFLGTVQGLVVSFGDIEAGAGTGSIIQLAAAGIKVALYTTILGLVVGIIAQWSYNALSNRIDAWVLTVEEGASELVQNLALMAVIGGEALSDTGANAPAAQPVATKKPSPAQGATPAASEARSGAAANRRNEASE